jgi:hypothetical protein
MPDTPRRRGVRAHPPVTKAKAKPAAGSRSTDRRGVRAADDATRRMPMNTALARLELLACRRDQPDGPQGEAYDRLIAWVPVIPLSA